ncbi:MAG: phosphoenolpyruvate synthase [Candidatus Pacearchaeota archaeon]
MAKKEEVKTGYVKWFSELSNKDVQIAGGKGASLAEMYVNKFPIPPGFVVTAQAYSYFIEKTGIAGKIQGLVSSIDMENTKQLEETAKKIRDIISNAEMPKDLEDEIVEAYEMLDVEKEKFAEAKGHALEILKQSHEPPFVAVRSSATTEDLAEASFAGQQETFLNVKGKSELIQKTKDCFASLFTARAIYYREKKGFGQATAKLAVVVQKMINSDKSGVMFSRSPVGDENNIMIEAVWGLGEGIVSGRIKPDSYIVDRDLENFKIIELKVSEKKIAFTRDSSGKNVIVKLTDEKSKQQVLTAYEIKTLAQYGKQLEEHYKKAQDIEFAIADKEIYIVQSRPVTTLGKEKKKAVEIEGELIVSGLPASPGIGVGVVKIVHSIADLQKIKKGDVLVTEMTNPDMVVTMQKAAAIVTDEGGITSHAAIVSREMGIPAVVGTGNATKKLKEGEVVTVDGITGKVLAGMGEAKAAEIKPIVQTKTKIKVIVDLPDFAQRAALSGAKSVGLTRIEGIIASSGKHPIMFVKQKKINDYVKLLYEGLRKIAEPFEEIWIRTSDIRSDEFRHLEGSRPEVEGNPMLGNHGIRFSLKNPEIIKAEIEAIKKVALEFPTKKIGIMIPQVIKVDELRQTKKYASEIDVPLNVRIGIMVETPAAVQIINDLIAEGMSFISFGTNDLTQYILAIDRNNSEVQYLYDEMDPAVLSAISYVIRRCKKAGVETSICGQAGSRLEMVKFLVENGIDSISTNADAAEKVSRLVAALERGESVDLASFGEENGMKKETEKKIMEIVEEMKEERKAEEIPIKNAENLPLVPDKQIMKQDKKDDEDIENVLLRQLEEEKADKFNEQKLEEHEDEHDYSPAIDGDKDIPSLNDAIPVDSSLLEKNKEEEFDLEAELNK